MRTEDEWQLREKKLLESNNRLLLRARAAERALVAAHNKKPQLFWDADDPEVGHGDLYELLEYADERWTVFEINTGYHGPKTFAALIWDPKGIETELVEAPTRDECAKLVDAARAAHDDEHEDE